MSEVNPSPAARAHDRWTRLAALGLVMAGAGPFLLILAAVLWGLDVIEDLPFFLTPVVLSWVTAFLVFRIGGWTRILGIVVAVVVGGLFFWTAFGLAAPTSFFDFVPGLLVIPGAVTAIVGCVASLVAGRRGREREPAASGGERRAIVTIVGVVGVLAALSGVLTLVSRSTVDASDTDAEVILSDFEYDEDAYELAPGSGVVVRNRDPFVHTFTIEELDVDVTLNPNSEEIVEIPSETGTYVVFCRPHTSDPEDPGDGDMAAELTIG